MKISFKKKEREKIKKKKSDASLSGTICGNYVKSGNRIFFTCLLEDRRAAAFGVTYTGR